MKRRLEILKRNIFKPHKIINHLGNKLVNPFFKTKMIFQPSSIDVEPITKCNLNCVFCPVPGWDRASVENLSIDNFKKIIKRFPFLIEIKLQGLGEPFLNKDIFEMIEYGNKKGILINIYTNSTLLNKEKIKKLLKSPPAVISFSLDTPNRETYKKIRGKDMFDTVIQNIKLTIQEKNITKSNSIIQIWSVLNKHNINEISGLVGLAKELNVDRLIIQTKLGSWNKEEIRGKVDGMRVSPFEEEGEVVLAEAKNLAKKIGLNFSINTANYFSRSNPCSVLKSSTFVSVEGEVVPCCVISDPRSVSMGNIYKENFSKIWNSKKYQKLREAVNTNNPPVFCKDCYPDGK